jgi:hypothetical protein
MARHTALDELLKTILIQRPGFKTRAYSSRHARIRLWYSTIDFYGAIHNCFRIGIR